MITRSYIEAPGCIFVSPVEFAIFEQDMDAVLRAEYGQTGYPRTFEGDESYLYIPVEINGRKYKLIAAARPELKSPSGKEGIGQ